MAKATPTSSTTVALPPLTTIFIQPSNCASLFTGFNFTSTRTGSYKNSFTTWTASQSNTADPRFSSCNPPGWDVAGFTFSPAVCPSGWIYYSASQAAPDSRQRAHSLASCCARGYTYESLPSSGLPSRRCVREAEATNSIPIVGNQTIYEESNDESAKTLFVHQPFVVQWHKTETKRLPFALPDLPSNGFLPKWTPGTTPDIVSCSPWWPASLCWSVVAAV
ncbi:hypothetical protein PWT90_10012 [Aphanocladium album]|nr:hypothetical protein PWT90_10012 [Aphanocladium album]